MMNDECKQASGSGHQRFSVGRPAGDSAPLERLQLFYGAVNPAEARVYACLPGVHVDSLKLSGTISGPFCEYSRTLSASTGFADRGSDPALLAEAIVADPCFWSPELPMLYRVQVELNGSGQRLDASERMLGIRPLATAGRRLLYAGRNLVLRGAAAPGEIPPDELVTWHAAEAAIWIEHPAAELLAEASRLGVWLLVTAMPDELPRIARWPAVAACILPAGAALDEDQLFAARNIILAQQFEPEEPIRPQRWCQLAVCCGMSHEHLAEHAAACPLPVMACRRDASVAGPADVRSACDRLQRALAGRGEFAGYFV